MSGRGLIRYGDNCIKWVQHENKWKCGKVCGSDVTLSGDDIMRRKLKVLGLYMRSKHDNVGGRNKERGTYYNKFDKFGF